MNSRISEVIKKIQDKLNYYNDETLNLKFKKIMENEKYLNDGNGLYLYDNTVVKKQMLSELEDLYDYINSIEYKLTRLKRGYTDLNATDDDVIRLLDLIDSDESITIDNYKAFKGILLNMKTMRNEKNIIKVKELIKPKKRRFKKMVSPKDFCRQFGFYPYENNKELVKYDLSDIDYTHCDLSNKNFANTNFCFDLSKLKNKVIVNTSFENCNLVNSSTNGLFIANVNFKNSGIIVDVTKLETKMFLDQLSYPREETNETENFKYNKHYPIDKTCIEGFIFKNKTVYANYLLMQEVKKMNVKSEVQTRLCFRACHKSQITLCNFEGCKILNPEYIVDFLGVTLPVNNYIVHIDENVDSIYGFIGNGVTIEGKLSNIDLRCANIKDSHANIMIDTIRKNDLSDSDVRGCNLIGNNECLNLKNTKYDEKEKVKRKV